MRGAFASIIAVVLVSGVAASPAAALCTAGSDARALQRSIRVATRCNDKIFRLGPGATCQQSVPPACAGTLATDTVALGYGPNNPPAAAIDKRQLRDQLNCQQRIGRAMTNYVGRKLRYLTKGVPAADAEARARKMLDRLPDRCLVQVLQDASGVVLPAVGPQCAAALPPPGGTADATAMRDCVHTLLSVWVDRWGPNPQPLRPNILFILTDDQRWDSTGGTHGLAGADVMPRTRAELGDKGVEFEQAFMTTPLCCPSRSSILSGQYAHRTGVYKNGANNGGADDFEYDEDGSPGLSAQALPVWLQNAGYRTSLIGKYLNGYAALWDRSTVPPEPPYVPPGWTEWRGMRNVAFFNYYIVEPDGMGGYAETFHGNAEADYSTDVLREKAKSFITDSVNAGEPFFLYLAFKAPHLPRTPAPRHVGLFATVPPWRPPSYNEADVSDKPAWVQALPLQDSVDLDGVRIDQLEMLQAVDEAIGGSTTHGIVGIMEHLRNLGVADDTLVVFFADNGWYWGEHRLRAKNNPYEEAIRSPMFVYYPKLAPLPRTETRTALNIDLAPTFAELAGAGVPIVNDGESLLRVIDGTQPSWRTDFLAESWPGNHPWALVHESQWKYTEIPLDFTDPLTGFETELYDLVADPYELTNVASDPQHAALIAQMAARLRQLRPNWPVDADPQGEDPPEPDDD